MNTIERAYTAFRAEIRIPVQNTSWEDAITQHRERDWHESRQVKREQRGSAQKRKGGWHKNTVIKRT